MIDRGVNVMAGVLRSQSARSGRRTTSTWNAIVIGIPTSRYASALRRNANPRAMYPPMTRVAIDRASEAAIDRHGRDPPAAPRKQAAGRSVHRTGVPARTDCRTSRIAWMDASASTPEMSESCVAVSMTR